MNAAQQLIGHLTEGAKPDQVITVTCRDPEGTLLNLLDHIKHAGNIGHSFSIIVDPDDKERMKKFFWDGDGSDSIIDIATTASVYSQGE